MHECTGSLHNTFKSSCCALATEETFVSCCVQWKGARILYLKLAHDPKSIAEFAEQLECESCISKIVHMLEHPSKDPISVFALEVSASKSSIQTGRLTALATLVMQSTDDRALTEHDLAAGFGQQQFPDAAYIRGWGLDTAAPSSHGLYQTYSPRD